MSTIPTGVRTRSSKSQSSQPDPVELKPAAQKAAVSAQESKFRKVATRVGWSFIMVFAFLAILYAGHLAVCVLVILLQFAVFRELVNVRYKEEKEVEMPYFRTLQWAWFAVAMFFAYGSSWLRAPMGLPTAKLMLGPFKAHLPFTDEMFLVRWIAFAMYAITFVCSVLSFRPGLYRYQIMQFTWTVLTLMIVVIQTKVFVYTVFVGLFWFVFPASLVVANDCFAYIAGMAMGGKITSRVFLELSPNKTWEGFIGGFCLTHLYAFIFSPYWFSARFLRCSYTELDRHSETCENDRLLTVNGSASMIQLHALLLAFFASVVAPFGGYFASAVKRAFKKKDFDSIIPGHGGFTDRMDCQFIMIACSFIHYSTFVTSPALALPFSQVMQAAKQLSWEEQAILLNALQTNFTA